MAPLIDTEMNDLMLQYYRSDHDPKFLYRGSQDNIVKELQAWVVYRRKLYQKLQEQREKIIKAFFKMRKVNTVEQQDAAFDKGVRHVKNSKILSHESKQDTSRAAYLLESLKYGGVLWPKLWWRPDHDGGVCSFLGTIDPTFDPDSTLSTLQNLHSKDAFRAKLAEYEARFGTGIIDLIDQSEGSLQDPSTTTKKNAEEASALSNKKATKMPSISALNTDPAKWANIVRAIDSGAFPDFRIEEAKLVAASKHEADLEMRLDCLLEEVSKDSPGDWALKGSL